jgi:hypothetical protein
MAQIHPNKRSPKGRKKAAIVHGDEVDSSSGKGSTNVLAISQMIAENPLYLGRLNRSVIIFTTALPA